MLHVLPASTLRYCMHLVVLERLCSKLRTPPRWRRPTMLKTPSDTTDMVATSADLEEETQASTNLNADVGSPVSTMDFSMDSIAVEAPDGDEPSVSRTNQTTDVLVDDPQALEDSGLTVDKLAGDSPLTAGLSQTIEDTPEGGGDDKKKMSFEPLTPYDQAREELAVARGESVLEASNSATDDPLFEHLNGGSDKLTRPKGSKPKEWSRGIVLEEVDGELTPMMNGSQSQDDRIAAAKGIGIEGLEGYRKRIIADFDFQDAMKYFTKKGGTGREGFLKSVINRYGPHLQKESKEYKRIEDLASEIWSYATLGHDTAGVTDIGQMQGLLFALDKEIARVSDGNTTHTGDSTTVGESEVSVEQLDGTHGRSTVLTTRMLMAAINELPSTDNDNDQNVFANYMKTYILADISSSMGPEMQQFARLITFGRGGDSFEISTFHDDERTLQHVQEDSATQAQIDNYQNLKREMKKLWKKTLKYEQDPTETLKAYKQSASKLNKAAREIFQLNAEQAATELSLAGSDDRDQAFFPKTDNEGARVGSFKESGILNAIEKLKEIHPYHPSYFKDKKRAANQRKQMLILTDETDSLLSRRNFLSGQVQQAKNDAWEKISLLQEMAAERNIEVKIVFSLQLGGAATSFQILKLDEITTRDVDFMLGSLARDWGNLANNKANKNPAKDNEKDPSYRVRQWSETVP